MPEPFHEVDDRPRASVRDLGLAIEPGEEAFAGASNGRNEAGLVGCEAQGACVAVPMRSSLRLARIDT